MRPGVDRALGWTAVNITSLHRSTIVRSVRAAETSWVASGESVMEDSDKVDEQIGTALSSVMAARDAEVVIEFVRALIALGPFGGYQSQCSCGEVYDCCRNCHPTGAAMSPRSERGSRQRHMHPPRRPLL